MGIVSQNNNNNTLSPKMNAFLSEKFDDKHSNSEILDFVRKQAGIASFTPIECEFVISQMKQKNLNVLNGEISFFKANTTGKICACVDYKAMVASWNEAITKKLIPVKSWNLQLGIDEKLNNKKFCIMNIKYNNGTLKQYKLYEDDVNNKKTYTLYKQTFKQAIRLYHPEIDKGYDLDDWKQAGVFGVVETPQEEPKHDINVSFEVNGGEK